MFSVESYPDPYCGIVDGMATACLEMNVIELWANDGAFDQQGRRKKCRSSVNSIPYPLPTKHPTSASGSHRNLRHSSSPWIS